MKTEPHADEISYIAFAAGNSDWIRNVVIPLAESVEEVIPRHVGDIPVPLRERVNRGAANHIIGAAIIGITLYATKKIGDDFYDVVIKPRVRKCFEFLDGKLTGGNRKKRKVFISNIWHERHNVVVSVTIEGKDFAEVVSQLSLLGTVHSNAINWIRDRGVSAPVHCYRIDNGKVNAEPLLLERVDEITRQYLG